MGDMGLNLDLGSLVGTVSSLFDGGHTERKNARKIAEYQSQLNDAATQKQNDWNLAQWNRQNEYDYKMWQEQNAYNEKQRDIENAYNSPIQQVQRLREAGINPAAAFGQGVASSTNVSSNNVPTSSAMTSAPYTPADFAAAMQAGNTSFMNQIQLQNVLASTAKMFAEKRNIDEDTESKETFNKFYHDLLSRQVQKNDVDITYTSELSNLTRQEAKQVQKRTDMMDTEWQQMRKDIVERESRIANIDADTRKKLAEEADTLTMNELHKAQINVTEQEFKNAKQQLVNLVKTGVLLDAETFNQSMQAKLAESNSAYTDAQKNGVIIQNGRLAIQFESEDKLVPIQNKLNEFKYEMDNRYKIIDYFLNKAVDHYGKIMTPQRDAVDALSGAFKFIK